MLLKKFKTSLLLVSFTLAPLLFLNCGHTGPRVATCISDGTGVFDCVDKEGNPFRLLTPSTINYVCFSPQDMFEIIQDCNLKK